MLFSYLNKRTTLKTLRVLKTLIVRKADILPPDPPATVIIISKIERETTLASSQFIFSLKYLAGPTAINLKVNSQIKSQVNTSPACSRKSIVA